MDGVEKKNKNGRLDEKHLLAHRVYTGIIAQLFNPSTTKAEIYRGGLGRGESRWTTADYWVVATRKNRCLLRAFLGSNSAAVVRDDAVLRVFFILYFCQLRLEVSTEIGNV